MRAATRALVWKIIGKDMTDTLVCKFGFGFCMTQSAYTAGVPRAPSEDLPRREVSITLVDK
jgi:hypothetical protein